MIVGLGGNNGSTFVAGLLANKMNMKWQSKLGEQKANFYGSFTQCATTHLGFKFNEKTGQMEDVNAPVKELIPMVDPVDFVVSGWDISSKNLYESCLRSQVLEPDLINQLKPYLKEYVPLPAALNPEFIASNQSQRADNVFLGTNEEVITKLRADI